MIVEVPRQDRAEQLMPRAIGRVHLAHVSRESTFINEARQRGLCWTRGVPIRHVLGAVRSVAQRWRQYRESESQRREHGLGERADVDHSAAGVQCLERFERTAAEAELAVVVVFDD